MLKCLLNMLNGKNFYGGILRDLYTRMLSVVILARSLQNPSVVHCALNMTILSIHYIQLDEHMAVTLIYELTESVRSMIL